MRSSLAWYLSLLAAVTAGACAAPRALDQPGSPVIVHITCTRNGNVTVTVEAWSHAEHRGGSFQWRFVSQDAPSISIAPKNPAQWPFPDPSYTVNAGGNTPVTVPQSAQPGTYPYTISGTCTDQGTSTTHNIVIDPDIVVD